MSQESSARQQSSFLIALAAATLLHLSALAALSWWTSEPQRQPAIALQVSLLQPDVVQPLATSEALPDITQPRSKMLNTKATPRAAPAQVYPVRPEPEMAVVAAISLAPTQAQTPAPAQPSSSTEPASSASAVPTVAQSADALSGSAQSARMEPQPAQNITEPSIIESSYWANLSLFKPGKISEQLGEYGTVTLEVLVGKDGRVKSAQVKNSSGFARLDQAALRGARATEFKPAMQGGQPIERLYIWSVVYQAPGT